MHHRPQADPAEPELLVDGAWPATALAARVAAHLELRRALLLVDECLLRHGLARLLSEREAEGREECATLRVGASGGHDRDVEAPRRVDLVVVDLGEDQLVVDAERVVAVPVEGTRRQPAEVADARDREADQAVEELPGAVAAERHLDPDGHLLAELEGRDRLLRARDDRLLPGDPLDVALGALDERLLGDRLADARVQHDLDEPGHLHDVVEAELVFEGRADLGHEALLQPRRRSQQLPALAAEADLLAVVLAVARARRALVLPAPQRDVRGVHGHVLVDDARLVDASVRSDGRRPRVALGDVQAVEDDRVLGRAAPSSRRPSRLCACR